MFLFSSRETKSNNFFFKEEKEERGKEISFDGPAIRFGLGNIRGRQRC